MSIGISYDIKLKASKVLGEDINKFKAKGGTIKLVPTGYTAFEMPRLTKTQEERIPKGTNPKRKRR